ncbi:hypothetical protein SmJEL517_g05922 [Synchytrium microbalum]|uniref:Uncharacterized protein n=1 Tax=Synchytrium microbalum TaxID=1806994 RepID=A0A507BYX9_9FUNG|nr:uncharacterized protein SmJEL517_g05922 [Synchytrium microbalum]TPX30545.1 hypothetical protein SmJEL517_g05922 [Synchytrium microbalum]
MDRGTRSHESLLSVLERDDASNTIALTPGDEDNDTLLMDQVDTKLPTHRKTGLFLLSLCVVAFVVQSEAVQFLSTSFGSPYFVLYFAHGFYSILLPIQYAYCYMSYGDSIHDYKARIHSLALGLPWLKHYGGGKGHGSSVVISRSILNLAVTLTLLFTVGSYSWYLAVSRISLGDLTAIYNTSCFWAYALSVILGRESLHTIKLASVGLAIAGVIVITRWNSETNNSTNDNTINDDTSQQHGMGYIYAISSSIFAGIYDVVYATLAVPEKKPSMLLSVYITGLLGIVTLILGLIPFPILHYTRFERFELPSIHSASAMLVISVLGVLYNASFMLSLAITGPVVASLGILLTIPSTTIVDAVFNGKAVGVGTLVGSLMILVSYVLIHREDCGGSNKNSKSDGNVRMRSSGNTSRNSVEVIDDDER